MLTHTHSIAVQMLTHTLNCCSHVNVNTQLVFKW